MITTDMVNSTNQNADTDANMDNGRMGNDYMGNNDVVYCANNMGNSDETGDSRSMGDTWWAPFLFFLLEHFDLRTLST